MWLQNRNGKAAIPYFLTGFFVSLAFLGFFLLPRINTGSGVVRSAMADNRLPAAETDMLRKSSESFRAVAKMVGPAVVTIKSSMSSKRPAVPGMRGRGHGGGEEDEGPSEDPFFEFFRRFGQPNQQGPQEPQTSLGSGIIVDKKGYIITNNHVVEGASKIVVNLPGDETTDLPAKVVGTDARTDLAVIRVQTGRDLPIAQWADSDSVEVGDWALAIGSPFMLTHSVTLGIVSAKGRNASSLMGSEYGYEMIQTDAAINPGNSGGPLCTIDGKVMGVNTAIFTRSGGYMGIGFAIPSNMAKDITSTLIKGGKVVRGWLGVAIQPIDDSMAKELGVKEGVLIHQVTPNSPAEKAGLKPGDVILEVGGRSAKEVSQIQHQVSAFKPGDKVRLKVMSYNDKKVRTPDVTIGELPAQANHEPETLPEETAPPDRLGLMVAPAGDGMRIERIEAGSIGEQVGFERGDKILSVNRIRVRTLAEYRKAVKSSRQLNVLVSRKGQQLFFRVTLP